MKRLRKNVLVMFLSAVLVTPLSGCMYLVVGSVGALGGYVVSPDTVEGTLTNKNFDEVWRAAVDVVSLMGIIQEQEKFSGIMIANVQGAKVTIRISSAGQDTTNLSVKARKSFLPKIKIAQDIYIKMEKSLYGDLNP